SPISIKVLNNSTLSVKYRDTALLNATIRDDRNNIIVGGNLTVIINQTNYTTNHYINGIYFLEYLANLDVGLYDVTASYNATNITNIKGQINITKGDPKIFIDADDSLEGKNATITVNVPYGTGNVTITVNGRNYTSKLNNSQAIFSVGGLGKGQWNVSAFYNGDSNYESGSNITTFNVYNIILSGKDIIMYFKNGTHYIISLTDTNNNPLANMTIYLTINNVTYERKTNESGMASLAINLNPGLYAIEASFINTNEHYAKNITNTVFVNETIYGEDITKLFRDDTQFSATFLDGQGKPLANRNVTFNINGVLYTKKTNENGTATLNINLNPGNYILTAIHPDTGLQMSYNITVYPTIFGSNITKFYKNETQYSVIVFKNYTSFAVNATVTFNINGVLYNRSTGNDGIATLDINLYPGDYIVTATTENGLSISNNITVLPTLIGEDLNKTFLENKTYDVKVLNGTGKPLQNQNVTININGKIYTKLSDGEGIARLDINLNPGSYIATASWNGYSTSNIIKVE
ncbi:hypothetical protein LJB96_05320, partial [Methanobrevibacter sp. OttesenSCG-928-K11]|nr:hypothetical protein [Methanobrevibacter sp. OttesenSCG-928-K11]